MELFDKFISAWHELEHRFPFGVMSCAPLFRAFGVSRAVCEELDREVFLDLMVPLRPEVTRIRVESRRSPRVSWIYIEKVSRDAIRICLQRSPFATFLCSVEVGALPEAVANLLMLLHRWPGKGKCGGGAEKKKEVLRRG
jgi:hypothetical protein